LVGKSTCGSGDTGKRAEGIMAREHHGVVSIVVRYGPAMKGPRIFKVSCFLSWIFFPAFLENRSNQR